MRRDTEADASRSFDVQPAQTWITFRNVSYTLSISPGPSV